MSSSSDSAERLRKYTDVLGDGLGPLYHALENEYFWLRLKWQEYLVLFASSRRVDILNSAAPSYFQLLQDALSDDILLHIARLTDPAKTAGSKANLSLCALGEAVPDTEEQLRDLISSAVAAAKFAKDWRNRRLAHRDLSLALGHPVQPLASATREAIDAALDSFHAVFAHICGQYFNSHLDSEVVEAPGGAEALLYVLRDGICFRNEQLERFEAGDVRPDDFEPLPS